MSDIYTQRLKRQFKPSHLLGHIILLAVGLVLLYPLIFMIMVAFFNKVEFASTLLDLFPVPKNPTLQNYKSLFVGSNDAKILLYIRNSALRAVYMTFCAIMTSFLAGYVFARLHFKWKEGLFLLLLATQMIPATMAIIPTYLEYARFPFAGGNDIFTGGTGILNTWWVYLIGGPAINIMGTFLVKQSLEKVRWNWMKRPKLMAAARSV